MSLVCAFTLLCAPCASRNGYRNFCVSGGHAGWLWQPCKRTAVFYPVCRNWLHYRQDLCVFLARDVRCRALLCQQIIFTLPRNALGIVRAYAYYVVDLCILQLLYKINFPCKYCGHVSGSLSNYRWRYLTFRQNNPFRVSTLSILCACCSSSASSVLHLRLCVQCAKILPRSFSLHPTQKQIFNSTSPARSLDKPCLRVSTFKWGCTSRVELCCT